MKTRWAAILLVLACGKQVTKTEPPPPALTTMPDAVRLLDQASFGPSDGSVADVQRLGVAGWIDEQLATPATGYAALPIVPANTALGCPAGSPATCGRDNYSPFPVQLRFFRNAVTGPDQLRQRIAFAWSQIFVISGRDIRPAYAVRDYEQLLLDDAFVSYRKLLGDITLSAAMGDYLDMANNDRANAARGIAPNENYAREILQLFSIGTVMLNADGTPMLDANGAQIPAYTQDTVKQYAAAFTGWTYPAAPGATSRWTNPRSYDGPMVAFDAHHEPAAKTLLSGVALPANQGAAADLAGALDSIVAHPNAGPFLGKQLIQFLVTSNPSPAYVARVSAVFNDDGKGARGNLGAVVRAVLLDPEARGDAAASATFGKLREPAMALTGPLRALSGTTDGQWGAVQSNSQDEGVFNAGSVFSFYPPDYALPGTPAFVAPQFGILNTTTVINRLNAVYSLLYNANGIAADPSVAGSSGTQVSDSSLQGDAGAMVDRLDALVLHSTMTAAEKSAVVTAVNAVSPTDAAGRARMAAWLVFASPRYHVQR